MTQQLPEGTVTVLFTDVVGSTDLTTRRGDEAAQEILGAQRALVREQIGEHSGHEVKGLGDGFMVAFASARRAVACAVGIQRALEEHNRGQPLDEQVLIRIGLNTGEVIKEEDDLFGETVNAAARIAAKAKGSQVLISEVTKGVIGRAKDVELVDRGRFRLKGFPERWHLFEVIWQEETIAAPLLAERTPYVGREAERAELRRFLNGLAEGRGALVMIGGEPGVGKTRIAEELAAEARQRGLLTLTGHCYEMEGAPPYIPFVEIVEASARLVPPEALRNALGDSAPEVAKLMPELRRLFPDIPPPLELPPAQERRYLFNGMRDFLTRAGRAQPMILVLDDLQWADDATLLLLQHIAQQLQEMPVLILGIYRDVELDVARPLARTLEELLRQRLAQDMTLKRLPEADVSAMLRALSGQEPPEPLVDVVYNETEGNPFFVEEVFQHLSEEGKLFDARGRWRTDLQVSELDVPRGVRLVIGRRLERVSEECRRALTTAAIIGRAFSFDLLEAVSDPAAGSGHGMDVDALLDAVDEAERAHLITSISHGTDDRFSFPHELIRQTLLSDVSAPRRRRLHLRVAEAMEQLYSHSLEEHAADIAHHLRQAGGTADPQKTVRYLTLAGERALSAAAFEDALRLYESALLILELREKPDEGRRCELLLALGDALIKAGDSDRARETFGRAAEVAKEQRAPDQMARAALGLGEGAGVGQGITFGILDEALIGALEEALEILGEGDSALRARVMARLAVALYFSESSDRRASLSKQAVEMSRRVGDARALAYVLIARREAICGPENVQERLAASTEIVRLAEDASMREVTMTGHLYRLVDFLELGDIQAVDREIEAYARLAEELRQPFYTWFPPMMRAMRALMEGRFEEAEQLSQQSMAMAQGLQGTNAVQGYGAQMGALRQEQGRGQELEPAIKGFVAQYPAMPAWRAGLALIYCGMGRETEARTEFERLAANQFADIPRDATWIAAVSYLSEVCAFLGDARRAAALYELLLPHAGSNVVVAVAATCSGSASRYLGLLAATMLRWDEAAQHFQDALEMNTRIGARPWVAWTQHQYADMLLARGEPGDREKALGFLTDAIDTAQELGMKALAESAEALKEKADSQAPA